MFIDYGFDQALVDLSEWSWVIECCVSCSLSVVAYVRRKENVSIPNVTWGNCVKILGESQGLLQMDFVSLMRSSFRFLCLGQRRRQRRMHI